jgi:hypothetical protein
MQPRPSPLDWIVRNRQVGRRAVPIGQCLPDQVQAFETRAAIRAVVAAAVDDEFRAHCSLGEVTGSRVVILVDSAAARSVMRLKWLTQLRSHLARHCGGFGARQLAFQVGVGEDRFAARGPGEQLHETKAGGSVPPEA